MDRWIVTHSVDLATGQISCSNGQIIHAHVGDSNSVEWSVELTVNGQPADVSGCSCIVYGNRSNKTCVIASGTIAGNICTAKLTKQFFDIGGDVQCLMKISNSSDDTEVTVSALKMIAQQGPYSVIIDPGDTMPSLSQGLAAIQALSSYTLTEASIDGFAACKETDTGTYLFTYADGESYTITVDGGNITIQQKEA